MTEQELNAQMGKVYEMQQICLRLQEVFVALTFPFYMFGIIPILANFFITLTWGIYLRNKASSLATTKYPFLGHRRVGSGFSWDPPVINEAKRYNDKLTIRILRFNYWSIGLVVAAVFVYLFMLTWWPKILAWQIETVFS